MTRWLPPILLTLLCACPAPTSSVSPTTAEADAATPPSTESTEPTEPTPEAADDEAAAADDEAAAADDAAAQTDPADAEPDAIWRFTTLVTGGPESLVGANGYYELQLDEDQATVRKVGVRGTPSLPPEKVMTGTGTLALTDDPRWSGARTGTVTVTLANAKSSLRMTLMVWLIGDELHGTWLHPDRKPEEWMVGRAWGLLQGVRGRGEPQALTDGEQAPCWACNEAFYNCEGMGSGGCNSSNSAIDDCQQRVRKASKRGGELPRGCGDWMHSG